MIARPGGAPAIGWPGMGLVLTFMVGLAVYGVAVADPSSNRLTIEAVAGPAWRTGAIEVDIEWSGPRGPALTLQAVDVELPGPFGRFDAVYVTCPGLAINARRVFCRDARLRAERAAGAPITLAVQLVYDAARGQVRIEVPRFAIAGGTVALRLYAGSGVPRLEVEGTGLAVGALPEFGDFTVDAGTATVDLMWRGDAEGTLEGTVAVEGLSANDASGRLASEALAARIAVDATVGVDGVWRGQIELALTAGGAYVEPVFLDLSAHPLDVVTAVTYAPDLDRLVLADLALTQSGVLEIAGGALRMQGTTVETARLAHFNIQFPGAYDAWLAGFLVGTPFATLDIGGSASGRIVVDDGRPQALDVAFEGVNIEERNGRFALYGLEGAVHWAEFGAAIEASTISFAGGYIYGAGFDGASLELGIAGAAIDLLDPVRIPSLGGALVVTTFTLRDYASDELALGFEAELEPIDLGQLTLALDWPTFAGTVAGRLPLLTYKNGVVTVGGTLEAHAFGGDIAVEDLRVERPLGLLPEIGASIRLRHLDLEQITQIVPFGRVTGHIDGDIEGLRLLKGTPIAFDARLQSIDGADDRRRLSQRAVETISRVAGGGAVLSTTFLRVFKNFSYERLGIACRLDNDVCHMDGVAPAEDGYYIVKGRSVPRVDLIGRVREVHWSRLIAQLKEALAEGEFVID